MDADRLTTRSSQPVSLILPAFNEDAVIESAIVEADSALRQQFRDYEIIVVDDGSSDRTVGLVREMIADRPNVRLIRHSENYGYGAALRTGFEAATFDRIAFSDADCQFNLLELGELVRRTSQSPIVVGWRVKRKDPWRRRFLSRGYNWLARSFLGTRVRDCDCALKVFRREALTNLMPESRGFFVNTEMLTRARQLGYRVVEVPVTHRPRLGGDSKVSLWEVPRTFQTLIGFWWTHVLFGSKVVPIVAEPEVFSARIASSSLPVCGEGRGGVEALTPLNPPASGGRPEKSRVGRAGVGWKL